MVTTVRGTSLADKLDLKNLPLAATPGGRVFAMKALHPSDHEIKSARVPGGNTMSVSLCNDQVTTIPLANANASVGINLIPSIMIPCTMEITDGAETSYRQFFNAAFGGSVVTNATSTNVDNFMTRLAPNVERYRITSQSVTVELIAPTLSDQGTITAAQYNMPPRTVNASYFDPAAKVFYTTPDVYLYERPVTISQLVLGTQAYTAKAREGVYLPLKLKQFKWMDLNDSAYQISQNHEFGAASTANFSLSDSTGWPFYVNNSAVTAISGYRAYPKMCGSNFGFISMEGMAANVALRIRVRQTIELTCRPSSTYAPLLEVALPPDETAIKMYFEISARMADAYPASYNDLSKLRSIIAGLAKKVGPYVEPALNFLAGVPGPIGAIAGVAKTAVPVARQAISTVRSLRKRK